MEEEKRELGMGVAKRKKGTKQRVKGAKATGQPPDPRVWQILPLYSHFQQWFPGSSTTGRFFFIGNQLWMLWRLTCLYGLGSTALVALAQAVGSRAEVKFSGSCLAMFLLMLSRDVQYNIQWTRSLKTGV